MSVNLTLTLDDDLALALRKEVERSGQPFVETINRLLRRGLRATSQVESARPFRVRARHLGRPVAGLDLDNIGELLERIEGPTHR